MYPSSGISQVMGRGGVFPLTSIVSYRQMVSHGKSGIFFSFSWEGIRPLYQAQDALKLFIMELIYYLIVSMCLKKHHVTSELLFSFSGRRFHYSLLNFKRNVWVENPQDIKHYIYFV